MQLQPMIWSCCCSGDNVRTSSPPRAWRRSRRARRRRRSTAVPLGRYPLPAAGERPSPAVGCPNRQPLSRVAGPGPGEARRGRSWGRRTLSTGGLQNGNKGCGRHQSKDPLVVAVSSVAGEGGVEKRASINPLFGRDRITAVVTVQDKPNCDKGINPGSQKRQATT